MALQDRGSRQAAAAGRPAGGLPPEKLGEQDRLCGKKPGILVLRKEPRKLILEDRGARGLEHDDRQPRPDLAAQGPKDLPQKLLREVEHPVVVERPAAAEAPRRQENVEAGRGEDPCGRARGFGMKGAGERIGPEENRAVAGGIGRWEDSPERLPGAARELE